MRGTTPCRISESSRETSTFQVELYSPAFAFGSVILGSGQGFLGQLLCQPDEASAVHSNPMRRLFTLASAVSLLLCLAACVLWVRSYGIKDGIWWWRSSGDPTWPRRSEVLTYEGRIIYYSITGPAPGVEGWGYDSWVIAPSGWNNPVADPTRTFFGFRFSARGKPPHHRPVASLPLWLPLMLLSVMPVRWYMRRRRGLRPGLCPACGYDLRATPDRCPECGAGVGPAAFSD